MILTRLNRWRAQLDLRKVRLGYRRKIARLLATLPEPHAVVDASAMSVRRYFPEYRHTGWHTVYATLNGRSTPDYLPEDLFYTVVERSLNNLAYTPIYHDKAGLGYLLAPGDYVGNRFFRLRGRYFDSEGRGVDLAEIERWLRTQREAVVKPARETGGGRGLVIGDADCLLRELAGTRHAVVVQPAFRQHPELARLNPDSVNSIRMLTLRHEGSIHVLSTLVRVGRAGSRLDNVTRGAIALAVDRGLLGRVGVDGKLQLHETHPDSGLAFAGLTLPSWPDLVALARRSHQRLLEADLASWDLTVGEDGRACVVEVNVQHQGLNEHQILNGPVFAPFLDDLLAGRQRRARQSMRSA